MEERNSLGDAFRTAIANLTGVNNEGNIRYVRWLFFLFFVAGSGFAGYRFYMDRTLAELEMVYPSPRPSPARADEQRLKAMTDQVEVTSQLRRRSTDTVDMMERSLAKYPFGPAAVEPDEYVVVAPDVVMPSAPIIDFPPEGITLRAIMIMGNQYVAVMDIPEVGAGMVVKPGDTFMQKKGRVVRIATDKVVVNWGGKNWDIAPSF